MIELWQVALALMAVSIGAWFEVERTYGKKVRAMKKRLLSEACMRLGRSHPTRKTKRSVNANLFKKVSSK